MLGRLEMQGLQYGTRVVQCLQLVANLRDPVQQLLNEWHPLMFALAVPVAKKRCYHKEMVDLPIVQFEDLHLQLLVHLLQIFQV